MELAGGVGALSLKPWARKALLVYAIGAIVAGLVGTVFNVVVMIPKLSQIPQNRAEVKMTVQLMPIMTIGGFFLGLILPVCVLIFMTRPKAKAAFADKPRPATPSSPPAAIRQPATRRRPRVDARRAAAAILALRSRPRLPVRTRRPAAAGLGTRI